MSTSLQQVFWTHDKSWGSFRQLSPKGCRSQQRQTQRQLSRSCFTFWKSYELFCSTCVVRCRAWLILNTLKDSCAYTAYHAKARSQRHTGHVQCMTRPKTWLSRRPEHCINSEHDVSHSHCSCTYHMLGWNHFSNLSIYHNSRALR